MTTVSRGVTTDSPAGTTVSPAGTTVPAEGAGVGVEWLVEARGCDPRRLADTACLAALFEATIGGMDLHPVAPAAWHRFGPAPGSAWGGVTGFCALAESHLAVHTFPEHGSLCLNVFCCRPRPEWDFAAALARHVGAVSTHVTRVERRYGGA